MNFLTQAVQEIQDTTEAQREADAFIAQIEQQLATIPEVGKPLPIPVQRFCSEIDKNFEITASSLIGTAERLENAAAELRKRAKDLRDASPDVRSHIERWIQFERESNERGKFLNALFER